MEKITTGRMGDFISTLVKVFSPKRFCLEWDENCIGRFRISRRTPG